MSTSNSNNNSSHSNYALRSILDKEKLNGSNFIDWHRNLRIVLKADKKQYVLEKAIPDEPPANATQAVKKAWEKHVDDSAEVSCLMLATMIPELQKNLEDLAAFDMITQLKEIFQEQARHERFETMKSLMGCQMQEGSSPCNGDGAVRRTVMAEWDNHGSAEWPHAPSLIRCSSFAGQPFRHHPDSASHFLIRATLYSLHVIRPCITPNHPFIRDPLSRMKTAIRHLLHSLAATHSPHASHSTPGHIRPLSSRHTTQQQPKVPCCGPRPIASAQQWICVTQQLILDSRCPLSKSVKPMDGPLSYSLAHYRPDLNFSPT
ncbi:hypothetical protein E3N88_10724 [Mikania micrantha]|uniref:Uncharacterized protein n=1 Tax=Mikania micrantha TaxID=192012 RepID=A0A5N6PBP6_9ASTR|nr:hypothetical protein E3N88_10724 [Mikania micrantha]